MLGRRLQRRADETRSVCERLESSLTVAKARAAASREHAKTAHEKAALAAERYRAQCHFLMAEKIAADQERPIEDLIERALRRKVIA